MAPVWRVVNEVCTLLERWSWQLCHSFDRIIRCLWLAGLISMILWAEKGALSESLCTACKNGEAAAGRHQHQVMPVLIGVRWCDEFRSVGLILPEILAKDHNY